MGTSSNVTPLRQSPFSGKFKNPRNSEVRSCEHLMPAEVERLVRAGKNTGRHGHRDATMILLAYRHGLRVSELVALRWDQVDLANASSATGSQEAAHLGRQVTHRVMHLSQVPASQHYFRTHKRPILMQPPRGHELRTRDHRC